MRLRPRHRQLGGRVYLVRGREGRTQRRPSRAIGQLVQLADVHEADVHEALVQLADVQLAEVQDASTCAALVHDALVQEADVQEALVQLAEVQLADVHDALVQLASWATCAFHASASSLGGPFSSGATKA